MSSVGFFTLGLVKLEVKAQMGFFCLQMTHKKVFNSCFVFTNHIAWINLPDGQLETCSQSITGLGGKVEREEKTLLLSPFVACWKPIPPVCWRNLPAVFLVFCKRPFGSFLRRRHMQCFLFQVFYGMEVFGIRKIGLGRRSQTKEQITLVSYLHIELEPHFWCAAILSVPGTSVFLLCLVGCYVWMQPRLEVSRAKMR